MTLTETELVTRPELHMESYKTPKRFTHSISVKLPDGDLKSIQVHEGTTVEELKHQIQDETGMPNEEQILEYSSKTVKQDKSVVVRICGYKKAPFVLKWRKRENKRQNSPVKSRDRISSHRLKQSRHNCIIFYYHTLCVLRPIWNRELQQSL